MSDIIAMEKSSLIAAITAEVAPLKEHIAALEARLVDARLRIDRDEDRLAQFEAALRKYGNHARDCAYMLGHYKGPSRGCDCGWIAAFPAAMGAALETKGEQSADPV